MGKEGPKRSRDGARAARDVPPLVAKAAALAQAAKKARVVATSTHGTADESADAACLALVQDVLQSDQWRRTPRAAVHPRSGDTPLPIRALFGAKDVSTALTTMSQRARAAAPALWFGRTFGVGCDDLNPEAGDGDWTPYALSGVQSRPPIAERPATNSTKSASSSDDNWATDDESSSSSLESDESAESEVTKGTEDTLSVWNSLPQDGRDAYVVVTPERWVPGLQALVRGVDRLRVGSSGAQAWLTVVPKDVMPWPPYASTEDLQLWVVLEGSVRVTLYELPSEVSAAPSWQRAAWGDRDYGLPLRGFAVYRDYDALEERARVILDEVVLPGHVVVIPSHVVAVCAWEGLASEDDTISTHHASMLGVAVPKDRGVVSLAKAALDALAVQETPGEYSTEVAQTIVRGLERALSATGGDKALASPSSAVDRCAYPSRGDWTDVCLDDSRTAVPGRSEVGLRLSVEAVHRIFHLYGSSQFRGAEAELARRYGLSGGTHSLERRIRDGGGLVRLKDFAPADVAWKAYHMLAALAPDEWTATSGYDRAATNNDVAHHFHSAKDFPNASAIFDLLRPLCPSMLSSFSAGLYTQGGFIEPHDDRQVAELFGLERHRAIALIWYLSPHWNASYGGALQDLDGNAEYVPEFNSVVAFRVPRWHQVVPVSQPAVRRFTVFGWFYAPPSQDTLPSNESFSSKIPPFSSA